MGSGFFEKNSFARSACNASAGNTAELISQRKMINYRIPFAEKDDIVILAELERGVVDVFIFGCLFRTVSINEGIALGGNESVSGKGALPLSNPPQRGFQPLWTP